MGLHPVEKLVHTVREGGEAPDQNVILLVATAILRDMKILVVREEDHPYNRHWVLPQGYVKRNETLVDAARREVREELGIDVAILRLIGVYEDFVKEKGTTLHYVTICYLGRPPANVRIHASEEVIDSAWIDPSNEFSDAPAVVQKMLKDAAELSRKRYSLRSLKFGS